MKKNLLVVAMLLLWVPLLVNSQDVEADREKEAVRQAVESYLIKDQGALKRALHPDAKIVSLDSSSGKILETPISKPAKKLPPGATVIQSSQKIVAIDVTRDGASVKVETDFSSSSPAMAPQKHIQYISLLKLKGEWKIVSILMPPLRFADVAGK